MRFLARPFLLAIVLVALGSTEAEIKLAPAGGQAKVPPGLHAAGVAGLAASRAFTAIRMALVGGGNFPTPSQPNLGDGDNPSSGDPVNLATGQENLAPPPDLVVYNPTGPSVSLSRIYGSQRDINDNAWNGYDFALPWSQSYDMTIFDNNVRDLPEAPQDVYTTVSTTGHDAPSGSASWEVDYNGTELTNSSSPGGWSVPDGTSSGIPVKPPSGTIVSYNYEVRWKASGSSYSGTFGVPASGTITEGAGGYLSCTTTSTVPSNTWVISYGGTAIANPTSPAGWTVTTIGATTYLSAPRNVTLGSGYSILGVSGSTYYTGSFSVAAEQVTLLSGSSYTKTLEMPNGSLVTVTAPSVPTSSNPTVNCTVPAGAPIEVQWLYESSDADREYVVTFKDGSQWKFTSTLVAPGDSIMVYIPTIIADRVGNYITLKYDYYHGQNAKPGLSEIDDSSGSALLTFYRSSPSYNINQIEDRYGKNVYYGYSAGVLQTVWQPLPSGTSNTSSNIRWIYGSTASYNSLPLVTSISVLNPTGSSTNSKTTVNYSQNIVTSIVDPNGNTTSYNYGDSGSHATVVTVKNSAGTTVRTYMVDFNANGDQTALIDANSDTVWTKTYSDAHDPYKPSAFRDESLSGSYTYTWDAYGNIQTSETPKGVETAYAWSYSSFPLGLLSSVQEGSKTATSYTYYSNGLIDTVSGPIPGTVGGSTQTSTFDYDSVGNVTEITTPGNGTVSNHEVTYGYTDTSDPNEMLGKPVTVSDTLSHTTTLHYDPTYHTLSTSKDANGNTTSYGFDIMERLVSATYPATGQSGMGQAYTEKNYMYPGGPLLNTQVYNEAGTKVRETDFTYGPNGEMLTLSGSNLSRTYTYNGMYQPLTVEDGNGNVTTYTYNTLGETTKIEFADSSSEQFTGYNVAGKLTGATNANGTAITYTYGDSDGLLTGTSYSPGSAINVTASYDSYDRMTSVSDGTGSHAFTYDDLNETLTNSTTYTGVSARSFTYTYNPDGSTKTMDTTAGDFSYTYDGAGRMSQLENPYSQVTTFAYQNNNWLSQQKMSIGVSANYTYYANGELSELQNLNSSSTVVSQFGSLTHDGAGDLLSDSISVPAVPSYSGTLTYTYDTFSQLASSASTETAFGSSGYSHSFGADSAGNLTTVRGTGYSYNDRNELSGSGLTYDSDGNPTTYFGTSATYDAADRLTALGSSFTAGYRYDGHRGWKNAGTAVYFYYDKDGNLVFEGNSSGTVTAINTFGPNGLISRNENSANVFYTYDDRGNTIQRFNSGGLGDSNSVDEYGAMINAPYDPYDGLGAQWGYYCDYNVSPHLYLLGHRYYDSRVGRFINQDPIGTAGGINVFSYGLNNPAGMFDPAGFCCDGLFDSALQGATNFFAGFGHAVPGVGSLLDSYYQSNGLDKYIQKGSGLYAAGGVTSLAVTTVAMTGFGNLADGAALSSEVTTGGETLDVAGEEGMESANCFDSSKVQHEFKHAGDFGIDGNWNQANGESFQNALEDHIANAPEQIQGTFRGTIQATHYYDPASQLWVGVDTQGGLVGAWKLGPEQIENLFNGGNIQ